MYYDQRTGGGGAGASRPPRGHTTPQLGQSNDQRVQSAEQTRCMRVSRGGVVPSGRAVPGAGAFGPRRCGGAPPHNRRTAVVLTAGERGPLAPRTARSRLSRTLRRRRARPAALRSSAPPAHALRPRHGTWDIVARLRFRLFPGATPAQGQATILSHNPNSNKFVARDYMSVTVSGTDGIGTT